MPLQDRSRLHAACRMTGFALGVAVAGLAATGCAASSRGGAPIDFRRADDAWRPAPGPATDNIEPASHASGAGKAAARYGDPVEVLEGDTLYAISERYRVALRALIETNDLSPPFALNAGQAIYLPPPNIHAVEPGETLYSISRRYNVDTRSLALMNGLPKPWTIYPGQPIRLPALARDQGAPHAAPQSQTVSARTSSARLAPTGAFVRPLPQLDGFSWPVAGELVRGFGKSQDGQRNDGVNIAAAQGAPFSASAAGEVVYAGAELAGFGKLLLIRHDQGWITAYAHAESLLVKEGDRVARGQEVGRVGSTGSVDTPQLHFQLRKGETAVDPTSQIQQPGLS